MKMTEATGVFFYNPKNGIQDSIDYAELSGYLKKFPTVKNIFFYDDFPWNEETILAKIRSGDLERLIIAGSCPGVIKTLFTKIMAIAGKDPD